MPQQVLLEPGCECAECLEPEILDPRAQWGELIKHGNQTRRRAMLDTEPPNVETIALMREYINLVSDSPEDLLWAMLEAERQGVVYFHLAENDREGSAWRFR